MYMYEVFFCNLNMFLICCECVFIIFFWMSDVCVIFIFIVLSSRFLFKGFKEMLIYK